MCAWRLLFRLVEVGVEPADEDVLDVQGLGKACLAACAVYIYICVCVSVYGWVYAKVEVFERFGMRNMRGGEGN